MEIALGQQPGWCGLAMWQLARMLRKRGSQKGMALGNPGTGAENLADARNQH